MTTVLAHLNLLSCLSPNYGDAAGPWLFRKITGIQPTWVPRGTDLPHYVTVGSILNWANDRSTVWGAGLASIKDDVAPLAKIAAVRGPLTRLKVILADGRCPEVYGDPALLCPRFHAVERPRKPDFDFGIFPHYVDHWRAREWFGMQSACLVINPLAPIEEVMAKIVRCKRIASSALHGLIAADSLGVPSAWVKMSDDLGGDTLKFCDYFMSVCRSSDLAPCPTDWRTAQRELNELPYDCADQGLVGRLCDRLMEVCPFREIPAEIERFRE